MDLHTYVEAFVGAFRRECPDKFIVFGESLPDHVRQIHEDCYNSVRVHSSLDNGPAGACEPPADPVSEKQGGIVCGSLLGGVLRHHWRAAA